MARPEFNRALTAINEGRFDEAHQVLTQALAQYPNDVETLYLLGVTEQSRQHHDTALALYDRILALSPSHLGAHYNKALLLSGLGRHSEALPHHDAAIRLAPDNHWCYVNRGNSRTALMQFEAAISDYDRALTLSPDQFAALANKGNALLEMGRHAEALACHERSLKLAPGSAAAWINTGRALFELHRLEETKRCAEQALKLAPDNSDAWCLHGNALNEMRLFEEAVASFQRAVAINSEHQKAWSNRGAALSSLLKFQEAVDSQRRAVELKADDFQAWVNLGAALHDLQRHLEAIKCYERALQLNPGYADAYSNMGATLLELGRRDEAQRCYEHALSLEPANPNANWNLSQLLIAQAAWPEGWKRFESRWEFKKLNLKRLQTSKPRWSGAPSDRPLLLWGEQGIGDQILYASVLPELEGLPQRKYVALDKRLIPLFARSMPGFEFIDLAGVGDDLDFAEQLPLGSLPGLFRSTVERFRKARHPFLVADPVRARTLREKITRPGKLVCGVSWASTRKFLGQHKSVSLEQMLPILSWDRLHFVDLQYGDTAAERQALQAQRGIVMQHLDEVNIFDDLDGLAALIQACDVVVTTSNTTAHMAGALGKETLLLLPRGRGRLWYWSDYDGHNPWYPTIHSFEQHRPGDWSQPMAAITDYLNHRTPASR